MWYFSFLTSVRLTTFFPLTSCWINQYYHNVGVPCFFAVVLQVLFPQMKEQSVHPAVIDCSEVEWSKGLLLANILIGDALLWQAWSSDFAHYTSLHTFMTSKIFEAWRIRAWAYQVESQLAPHPSYVAMQHVPRHSFMPNTILINNSSGLIRGNNDCDSVLMSDLNLHRFLFLICFKSFWLRRDLNTWDRVWPHFQILSNLSKLLHCALYSQLLEIWSLSLVFFILLPCGGCKYFLELHFQMIF